MRPSSKTLTANLQKSEMDIQKDSIKCSSKISVKGEFF